MSDVSRIPATVRPPKLVTDGASLEVLAREMGASAAVAIDCEQNGLYAFQARVCLLQVTTKRHDWIVDPLAVPDLSALAGVLADPGVVKIFHAAEEDVIGLARDFSLAVNGLFDTMWAAKMLGWPKVGLAPILLERYGVVLDKRMQRHDWGRRPLDQSALSYAQLDTHYLTDLFREQERDLKAAGRLEDAREVFAELAESRALPVEREPWGYRVKGERDLSDRGRAIAHALADSRERRARRSDRPAFKVIGDRELLAIAKAEPKTLAELGHVADVSPRIVERHGRWLVEAVLVGLRADPPPRPPKRSRDDTIAQRYEAMRAWRNSEAARHGVPGEVIVPNDALRAIARHVPKTFAELGALGVLGPRRLAAHGERLLEAMKRVGPPYPAGRGSVSGRGTDGG
jgi:ribonuclease D